MDTITFKSDINKEITQGKEIGRGAFAIVREGAIKATNEKVAIKRITRGKLSGDKAKEASIVNEIGIMKRISDELHHPNIIKLHDVFADRSFVFIVMEKCEGGELFDRIVQAGHFSEQEASNTIKCLFEAIKALHDRGIVHRDIKPENVLYDKPGPEGILKLTDFGVSQVPKNLVGSPGYVAPEVLSKREYRPENDIWSLGVVLYILLAGSPPFGGSTNAEMFDEILRGRYYFYPELWDSVSDKAKDLVRKILVVDPDKRPKISEILAHPFITEHNSEAPRPEAMKCLKAFNAKRKFRAAATAIRAITATTLKLRFSKVHVEDVVVPPIGVHKMIDAKTIFARIAPSGFITRTDFPTLLRELGIDVSISDKLFDVFDRDGSGEIDSNEFLIGMTMVSGSTSKDSPDVIKMLFNFFDEDGNGEITPDELTKMFHYLHFKDGDQAVNTAEKINEIFTAMDVDHNGVISFEEFNIRGIIMQKWTDDGYSIDETKL